MSGSTLNKLLFEKEMTPAGLAKALGLDRATVSRWCHGRVPAVRVVAVERITGIPRELIRPDVFGDRQSEPAQ